jgi:hypothetical protein
MPMRLDEGWNQIQFNLSDFTRRAYLTNYIETLRVQIHANCRIRRIYFSDRLYQESELPPEFKLYLPVPQGKNQPKSSPHGNKESKQEEVVSVPVPVATQPIAEESQPEGDINIVEDTPLTVENPETRMESEDAPPGGEGLFE